MLARWHDLRATLRRDLHREVPDRSLFVLCALKAGGYRALLSPEEQTLVEAAAPDFERALLRHPGLAAAAEDVCASVRDFEGLWQAYERGEQQGVRPAHVEPHRAAGRWVRWGVLLIALGVFVLWAILLYQRDAAKEPRREGVLLEQER